MPQRETFSIRIQPTLMQKIKLTAVKQQITISEIAETALNEYLKEDHCETK